MSILKGDTSTMKSTLYDATSMILLMMLQSPRQEAFWALSDTARTLTDEVYALD